MDEDRSELVERFLQAQGRVFRAMDRSLGGDWVGRGFELTMAQLKVLMMLHGGERHHLGDVAERLGIGPSAASHVVDRLVRQGWVARREDPEDRRYVLLERTEAGNALVDRFRRGRGERLRGWLARLTPHELTSLTLGFEALARVAADEEARV